jgi:tRNA (guanine-N7-)-methyltransferase
MPNNDTPRRPIRSFVRREGRMTEAQRRALDELLSIYHVPALEPPLHLPRVFGRKVPVMLEIGFGNGASLVELAVRFPQCDFLGIEVHRPGVGHLLQQLQALGLTNVRVLCEDAVRVVREMLAPESLNKILLWFPDPWPKTRHQKRRLLQEDFARVATERLEIGGQWHVATDWEDYARAALSVLEADPRLRNLAGAGNFAERPDYRPGTKYETRGKKLGHPVFDLLFERIA